MAASHGASLAASLAEAMETAIYDALKQRLPSTTMVPISHRSNRNLLGLP
jgi:ABC-type uncharacterized transport system fused permease/ATPase subunit